MMLTEEQREEIRRSMQEFEPEAGEPVEVVVLNQPEEAEEPDLTPALEGIAKAIEGIKGKMVADAILMLTGVPDAIDRLNASVKKLAESQVKHDLTPIIEAISKNTAALTKLAAVMASPKEIIFDEYDENRPIGLQISGKH